MAERHCPLCDGSQARRLVTKRGCDVVRCAACGMVYVWPQPTPEEIEAIYSAGAYHAAIDEAERRRTFARRLRQIEEQMARRGPARSVRLEPVERGGRVLDVGCSKGIFLSVARAEGWDTVGTDLNRNAVEEARARGLDVRHGDLAGQGFEAASFDVVTLFDLLEHTRDPRAILAECRRILRPSGLLVVTTPDIGGLAPRATYWLFARTLGAWDHPTPPGHLVQFSRRTLRRMLRESGFEIAHERTEHIPMAYSVGKLEDSILDVLAGRHRVRPVPSPGGGVGAGAPPESRGRLRMARRAVRCAVRLLAWLIVGATGLLARAIRWGDSMMVMAQPVSSEEQ